MTRIDEIAHGIYRISTPTPALTFNQFLLMADEPLLFHLGHRKMFAAIAEAVERVVPVSRLRWLSFSHVEADECGALPLWLEAAPGVVPAHSEIGCRIWLNDALDEMPRALKDGETLDLGGRRVKHLATPHLPHGWDAGLLFDETTATLLCSDLFAHPGAGPALAGTDILPQAIGSQERSRAMSLTRATAPALRQLAALKPKTLAVMHGSSFAGDCAAQLEGLAAYAERALAA